MCCGTKTGSSCSPPKTEHHPGKDCRIIPMFPKLKPFFDEAWELAGEDAEYVVGGGYLEAAQSPQGWRNCNLRTQFERLIKRAGLKPWPRLFHAMRASRETELAKSFPIHVVTAWIGNTPKIAMKNYLEVTDADFEEAIGKERDAENDAKVTQFTTQHTSAETRPDSQPMKKALEDQGLMQNCASSGESQRTQKVAGILAGQPHDVFGEWLPIRNSVASCLGSRLTVLSVLRLHSPDPRRAAA